MNFKTKLFLSISTFLLIICIFTNSNAMLNYQTVGTPTGFVTATTLNVRQWTGTNYSSPFDMLKSYKVSYKTAGENIAGNSNNSGAVNTWMNSEGHKTNKNLHKHIDKCKKMV